MVYENILRRVALAAAFVSFAAGSAVATDGPSHALAMHGEPKYGPDFTHFDYVNPDAPKGGLVRFSAQGTFDSFNPFIIKGNAAPGAAAIYDTLMVNAADEPFTEYAHLAETVETPADRSWVQFVLRTNARWHDGKPVTPEDVIWTFEALVNHGAPFYRAYYSGVAKVEKTGPRAVKFTFKPGDNRELPLILGQIAVTPKHYWENRDFSKTTLEPPLGGGPYRIATFEAGRSVTYERVEDYWAADLPTAKGLSNFGTRRYDMYRDRTVMREAFKGGAFDIFAENLAKSWVTGYDIPEVRDGLIVTRAYDNELPSGMQGFAFNLRREIFQDARVRQAIAQAFDFEWSNENLFFGGYSRTKSFFDNSELASRGLPSPEELELLKPLRGKIPDEVFTQTYAPPTTAGGGLRQNLRKAVGLLKQAGWILKDRKLVNAETGKPMAFEFLLVNPNFERIVLPFTNNLERLGIEVSVRTVDAPQYIRRLENFDFDMITMVWGQSLSPGNEQLEFWGADAADRPGSRNFIGLKDEAINRLIEAVIAAPDRDALITRVRALDRVLLWGHYVIPNWYYGRDRLAYWNIFGQPDLVPMRGVVMDAFWVDPEKAKALEGRRKTGG